jgi:hypothetical protein
LFWCCWPLLCGFIQSLWLQVVIHDWCAVLCPKYLTPILITTSLIFPIHLHGYEKIHYFNFLIIIFKIPFQKKNLLYHYFYFFTHTLWKFPFPSEAKWS